MSTIHTDGSKFGEDIIKDMRVAPMNVMVGQTHHYNVGGIDPNTFAMANNWDPCAYNILRYLARHRVKAGREDCLKASHYVHIRLNLIERFPPSARTEFPPVYTMGRFVEENMKFLRANDIPALHALERWVVWHNGSALLVQDIKTLIAEYDKAA